MNYRRFSEWNFLAWGTTSRALSKNVKIGLKHNEKALRFMFGLNNIKTITQPLQWNGQQFITFCANGWMWYLLFSMPLSFPLPFFCTLIPCFLSVTRRHTHTHTQTFTMSVYLYTLSLSQYISVLLFKMSLFVLCFLYLKQRNRNENNKWKEKNWIFLMRDLKINHTKYQLWGAVYSLSVRVLEMATLNRKLSKALTLICSSMSVYYISGVLLSAFCFIFS